MKMLGKIALVTGAAHRVGRAIALALAKEGADVVVHYGSSASAAQDVAREIESLGRRTLLHQADMGSWAAAESLGDAALAWQGRVDLLVNSAATFNTAGLLEATEADFDMAFDVNIKGVYALSRVIGRAMLGYAGVSNIINIVDEGAFFPWKGYVPHGVSKAALLALTRAQALNLGPKVRVNAICPGPILKPPDYSEERWQALRKTNPLHELGSAEQVAETVVFLATGPQFINGDCIMLDGGRMWQHQ
ncbi:MAG: SDR family oxidoreductase [Chloroflexi bacterium]|nr:SDR family oxidoreductase [Chloroflexota bacterium]